MILDQNWKHVHLSIEFWSEKKSYYITLLSLTKGVMDMKIIKSSDILGQQKVYSLSDH